MYGPTDFGRFRRLQLENEAHKPVVFDLIGLFFFYYFRFWGGGGWIPPLLIIFVACGPIATKFCTRIDKQSISSNMEKVQKVHDVITVRKLAEKTVTRT